MASVSLTRNERFKIQGIVAEQYKKLIMSFNENSDIRAQITLQLLQDSFKKLKDIPDNVYKYINTAAKDRLARVLTNIKLPISILEFDGKQTNFLANQNYLAPLEYTASTMNIPQQFIDNNVVPIILIDYMVTQTYSGYDKHTVALSEEQTALIEAHNTAIANKVNGYIEQLSILKDTIDKCKSTKMFEAQLPELVNLYPESVIDKLAKKNYETKELSEKELAIQGAINSFAAASLIENTPDT